MRHLLDLSLLSLAICAALPSGWFFLECVLGALYRPRPRHLPGLANRRVVVLMPAHDERAGIQRTVQALLPQLNATTQLYVIADNCSDDTAKLAADSGAHVFQRHDSERRGKGYALAFGIEQLAADPPDVIVIVDADCEVSAGGIARLAESALAANAPIQADYWLAPSARPSGRSLVSALAFLVKNRVRPRGLKALGLPCLLTGTGMAFPWAVLRKAPPTNDHLVEDMVMGLELAQLGHAPRLCAEVCVTSALPEQKKAASAQRKRWEHGHLATLFSHAPRLLARGIGTARVDLLALALDLAVPPLSLLVLLLVAGSALCGLATLTLSASPIALGIFVLNLTAIAVGVLAGWLAYGRELVRARDLLAIPLYVLWKLPLYFSFFTRGKQRAWERTERAAPAAPPLANDTHPSDEPRKVS
jgi:cellulose synthase/poly-beta-1,6-N-acetylglucosamine synthase-like glycosyltransferase